MGKKFKNNGLLKKGKDIKLVPPNKIGMGFYLQLLGDEMDNKEFTAEDLANITLLDNQTTFNMSLLDQNEDVDVTNIYSLLDEGLLEGIPTGADTGIYDYEPIVEEQEIFDLSKYTGDKFVKKINEADDTDFSASRSWEDEYEFSHCMLAQENPLGGEETKVVITFKGYLELTNQEYSFIKKANCNSDGVSVVYIPQYYVRKYQLRNGDEILGTCNQYEDKMILKSLFTINQIPHYDWVCNRPWFHQLKPVIKPRKLTKTGEYTDAIAKKFGLLKGDNLFLHINPNSQKVEVLNRLMGELSNMFDKVIYICPNYKNVTWSGEGHNIVKFCTSFSDKNLKQATIALLGAHYARRLIEMGKNVVVVLDDIDAINMLDDKLCVNRALSKTIFDNAKCCDKGAITNVVMAPLRTDTIDTFNSSYWFKSAETVGIIIDNNEIDLYSSYRV